MTLTERFAALTPEQREKFNAVGDGTGLEAFLSEIGFDVTADEKARVLEYIATGKLQLSDEEISTLAGGSRDEGSADGREVQVGSHRLVAGIGSRWFAETCGACSAEGGIFAKSHSGDGNVFYDCKCYNCGKQWTKLSIQPEGIAGAIANPDNMIGAVIRPY